MRGAAPVVSEPLVLGHPPVTPARTGGPFQVPPSGAVRSVRRRTRRWLLSSLAHFPHIVTTRIGRARPGRAHRAAAHRVAVAGADPQDGVDAPTAERAAAVGRILPPQPARAADTQAAGDRSDAARRRQGALIMKGEAWG